MAYRPGEDIGVILERIRNPLVFYALTLLTLESFLYLSLSQVVVDNHKLVVVILMVALFVAVIGIVAYITIKTPEHLYEKISQRVSGIGLETESIKDLFYNSLNDDGWRCIISLKTEEAIEKYNKAVQLQPNKSGAYSGLAIALAQLGDYKNALIKADKAIEFSSARESRPLIARSEVYSRKKQFDKARADLDEARKLNPKSALLNYAEGNLLFDQGEYDKAEQAYTKVIADDSIHAGAYHNRAAARQYLDKFDEAFIYLKRAIFLDPPSIVFAKSDPDLAKLRSHPEYSKKIEEILLI